VLVDAASRALVDVQLALKRANELELLRVAFREPASTRRTVNGWWFEHGNVRLGRMDTDRVVAVVGGTFTMFTLGGAAMATGTGELVDVLDMVEPADPHAAAMN
jgi:hypothetical protein